MIMDYIPARLVKGKTWYIVYYTLDPLTGKKERFRASFDLNRIRSARDRLAKARHIVAEINQKLPYGYPFSEASETHRLMATPIAIAIRAATAIKIQGIRPDSARTYTSFADLMIEYLEKQGLHGKPVGAFSKADALIYMDAMWDKGIGPRTYNNYLNLTGGIFAVLKDRNYIKVNPFEGIRRKPRTAKTRRAFHHHEARIMIAHSTHDPTLRMGMLLQYYCFIRPKELRMLRVQDVDLAGGVIRIPGAIAKSTKDGMTTIPDTFMPELAAFLEGMPERWYLFGKRGQPGPFGPSGRNTMNFRHKQLLDDLKRRGLLFDLTGLSYYSWKDTGALALALAGVPALELKRQMRHGSLEETQKYLDSLYSLNKTIKSLDNRLI